MTVPDPRDAAPVEPEMVGDSHYIPPKHGWTCFHCGITFPTGWLARQHFGGKPLSVAACQIKGSDHGLVFALRDAEDVGSARAAEIAALREENGQIKAALTGCIKAAADTSFDELPPTFKQTVNNKKLWAIAHGFGVLRATTAVKEFVVSNARAAIEKDRR